MKQIVDYFDRTYVINLEDREDRRNGTIKEFSRVGIDIPSPKVHFYTATRPHEQAEFPTLGARGSFTSHRSILDLARGDQLRSVLVFEDDVRFLKISSTDIKRIVDGLCRCEWDVAYFGYLSPSQPIGNLPFVHWNEPIIGGHFYGVRGNFIAEMAQYMHECEARPAGHPYGGPMFRDGAYNHIKRVNPAIRVFLAAPNLAIQRSSRTDVHDLRVYDRVTVLAPAMRALRAIKNRIGWPRVQNSASSMENIYPRSNPCNPPRHLRRNEANLE